MKNARVLIVEDDATTSMSLKYRVETLGYHVLGIVDTAQKAIDFVRCYRPDLVLMDIGLRGDVDGIAAARDIWRATGTPFVYVTAYSEEILQERTEGVEPYGFVGKPFNDRELQAAIELALYKAAVESSVRRNERFLEAMVAGSLNGAIAVDKQRKVLFMNPLSETMTGQKSGEALQHDVTSVIRVSDPETQREFEICLGIVLREGGALTVRNLSLAKHEGSTVNLETTITAVSNRKGEIEGAVISLQDTTQQQKVERELALQKQFFRQLFDESPEAIAILDRNDSIMDINRAFTELFQYSPDEARGKNIDELIVPREYSAEARILTRELHSEALVRAEALRRRKDGTHIPVSILAKPLVFSESAIGGYVVYREITDVQRRSPSSHHMMRVLEQLPIPAITINHKRNVTFANRRFLDATARNLKDVVGKEMNTLAGELAAWGNHALVLVTNEAGDWKDEVYCVRLSDVLSQWVPNAATK